MTILCINRYTPTEKLVFPWLSSAGAARDNVTMNLFDGNIVVIWKFEKFLNFLFVWKICQLINQFYKYTQVTEFGNTIGINANDIGQEVSLIGLLPQIDGIFTNKVLIDAFAATVRMLLGLRFAPLAHFSFKRKCAKLSQRHSFANIAERATCGRWMRMNFNSKKKLFDKFKFCMEIKYCSYSLFF